MDRTTYKALATIVYDKSGIALGPAKIDMLKTRLGKRLRALRLSNHRDYLKYLEGDKSGDELVNLLDVISTNVTGFFREQRHFKHLREFCNQLVKEGRK